MSAALIEEYLAGSESIRREVDGLSPEQLRARPVDGTWSTLELVCHLADTEALFAERMKRVLAEDRPTLAFVDPDRYASALAYHDRNAAEELELITLLRRQMTHILSAQPADAWQRVGIHSKEGERTLEQLVRKAIDHLEHHLGFLRAKRAMLGEGIEKHS